MIDNAESVEVSKKKTSKSLTLYTHVFHANMMHACMLNWFVHIEEKEKEEGKKNFSVSLYMCVWWYRQCYDYIWQISAWAEGKALETHINRSNRVTVNKNQEEQNSKQISNNVKHKRHKQGTHPKQNIYNNLLGILLLFYHRYRF